MQRIKSELRKSSTKLVEVLRIKDHSTWRRMSLATGRDQLERMFSFAAASDLEINIPDGTETSGIYHNSISCSRTLVAEGVGTSTEQSAGGQAGPLGIAWLASCQGQPVTFHQLALKGFRFVSTTGPAVLVRLHAMRGCWPGPANSTCPNSLPGTAECTSHRLWVGIITVLPLHTRAGQ